jgi:hypothetical protein
MRDKGNTPEGSVAWLRLSEVAQTRAEVENDRIVTSDFERDARRIAPIASR